MGILGLSDTNSWVILGVLMFIPIAVIGIAVIRNAINVASETRRNEQRSFKYHGNLANIYHRDNAEYDKARNNNNARNKLFEGANDAKKERESARIAAARNAAELEEAIGLAGRRRKDSSRKSRKSRKTKESRTQE